MGQQSCRMKVRRNIWCRYRLCTCFVDTIYLSDTEEMLVRITAAATDDSTRAKKCHEQID